MIAALWPKGALMQTGLISLFKVLTVGALALGISFSSISHSTAADSVSPTVGEERDACKGDEECLKWVEQKINYVDRCEQAKKNMNDRTGEFTSASGTGLDESLRNYHSCTYCSGDNMPSYCPGAKLQKERKNLIRQSKGLTKLKYDVGEIASCPTVAASEYKELQEKIKEHKDRIKELEESLIEKESELAEAKNKFQNETEEINATYEKEIKELEEKTKLELGDNREAYDKLNQAIMEALNKQQEITNGRIEAIRAAERECYNRSLSQLDVFRKDRREAIMQNQLSAGGQRDLLSSTGKTRVEKDRAFAEKYYAACLKDKNHTDKIKAINESYEFSLNQILQSIESARKEQLKLIEKISGPETRKKFEDGVTEIMKKHAKATDKATREYQTTSAKLQTEIERLKRDLQIEKAEQSLTVQAYGAADEARNGKSGDKGSDFLGKYSPLSSAARDVIDQCGCQDNKDAAFCKEAQKIQCAQYDNADQDPDCSKHIIDLQGQLRSKSGRAKGRKRVN